MLEKEIEKRLVHKVKEVLGGRAYKFVSPGNSGVPDRIVCVPGGGIFLVELKAPGERPRPLQQNQLDYLRGLGVNVRVVDSKRGVDDLIEELQSWMASVHELDNLYEELKRQLDCDEV